MVPAAIALLLSCPGLQTPSATLSYTIISNGTVEGSEVDTFDGNKVHVAFEFNDRGRGPKVSGDYVLSESGLPQKVDLAGVDYFKAPVSEHFWVAGDKATWKSTSEKGQGKAGGFYLSINGPSIESGFLASALLKGSGGLPIYPGGQASIQKIQDTTVTANSQTQHVTEYAISGLGFSPEFIWLDDSNQFFAFPSDWTATIRRGWESTNKQLFDLQTRSESAWYSQVARQIEVHPTLAIAFEHVRLFDSEHAKTLNDQTVVVNGEKIGEVGPAASVHIPDNAQRIDGKGETLLPGLFDMHTHLGNPDGLLDIACGVTSVRDMGNGIDSLATLQKAWDSGDQAGPRVFKAGLIDGTGPYQCPTGLYADTLDQALADANKYIDDGYIQIKIYSSLNPDFVPALVKLAHSRGVRVSGHVPQGLFATEFVNDGVDEIQHMNFIILNFLRDKVKDTRTPERFTAVAQYGASIDQNSQAVKDFIALLLSHHITVDATVATFEDMFCARPGLDSYGLRPVLDRMPSQVQRGSRAGGLPTTPQNDKVYKDSFNAMLSMLGKLYNAGVPILAGTDDLAGFMLHRELELEVRAGIPPAKALQIATWNAASLLKQQNMLGSIAPGKTADLYLVAGNPMQNISDVRRSRFVMKDGVLYDCDKVCASAGIGPSK